MAQKSGNDAWLAEKLAELKAIQVKIAAKRGAAVAATCGRNGEINYADVRDLYVAPRYSARQVYITGPSGTTGAAVLGCKDRRRSEYVEQTQAAARYLRGLGFRVTPIRGDATSYRIA